MTEPPGSSVLSDSPGQWVAMTGDAIVASGASPEDAMAAAIRLEAGPTLTLRYVEPPDGSPLALSPFLAELAPLVTNLKIPVYLVGGAVRDALRDVASHDLDFAVPSGAIKLTFDVANALAVPAFVLDRERDTGRVVVEARGVMLDFARFRGAGLEADLRARDFTVNAMALPAGATMRASLIDPTGGLDDLGQGLLRQTHPRAIPDDPIRALRAIRLRHDLGLRLDPATAEAVAGIAANLSMATPERVRDELVRVMQLEAAADGVADLERYGLLDVVLPEISALAPIAQSPPHHESVLDHTCRVLRWLGRLVAAIGQESHPSLPLSPRLWEASAALRPYGERIRVHLDRPMPGLVTGLDLLLWAAVFHDVGKAATQTTDETGRLRFFGHAKAGADLAMHRLRALRFSNEAIRCVCATVNGHMRPLNLAQGPAMSRRAVYRYFRALDDAGVDVALLALADHLATYDGSPEHESEGMEAWERLLRVCEQLLAHYFGAYETTIRPRLLLDGRALMSELGIAGGPEIGRLLRLIEEAQAAGEIETPSEALALARQALSPRSE